MTTSALLQIAAWSAYLSAAATLVTLVTGILFFTRIQPFGMVNDAASVLQMVFMLPLAWVLHILLGQGSPALSLAATLIGSTGMPTAAVLQALLVIGRVRFEQTFSAVLAAGAMTGVWLVAGGYLALAGGALPVALAWLGIVAGSAYVLSAVAYFVRRRQGRCSSWALLSASSPTRSGLPGWAVSCSQARWWQWSRTPLHRQWSRTQISRTRASSNQTISSALVIDDPWRNDRNTQGTLAGATDLMVVPVFVDAGSRGQPSCGDITAHQRGRDGALACDRFQE